MMFIVVLGALSLGVVFWYVSPIFSGRGGNFLLVVGLAVLALCFGMFGTPEFAPKNDQSTGILPGTLGDKRQLVETLTQKREEMKEQILASRDWGAVLRMAGEARELEKRAERVKSDYERDRKSPPSEH
ncbi:hypothetical protein [Leptolyngbya sp. GGD]|uniref:hypothetical protein n=1 Tax=Leptolyngbya sp. GGD TaxID=2997907 RepID=UPI00227BA05F|nr:hypothetical protein [Leptolyngbya sp. GGD]MCY6494540.1 hypothetical protein [Leptolyngbya sp. GGD]